MWLKFVSGINYQVNMCGSAHEHPGPIDIIII